MLNLIRITVLFALTFLCCFQAGAQGQSQIPENEDGKWAVKLYPLKAITGFRAEVAYRLAESVELNGMGTYYHHVFFWSRVDGAQFPTMFYQPSNGYSAFLSIDKILANRSFTVGGRIGYKQVRSEEPFEVSGNVNDADGLPDYLDVSINKTYFLFVSRIRSGTTGFALEFVLQGGLSYTNREERNLNLINGEEQLRYIDERSYLLPHVSVGFNLGFGW